MDFFLSLEGSKAGPFSIFKVGDLLAAGKADPDTLAWHRGLEEWRPIREIPALDTLMLDYGIGAEDFGAEDEDFPPPPLPPAQGVSTPSSPIPASPAAPSSTIASPRGMFQTMATATTESELVSERRRARPFIRFWARMFDYTLVSVLVFQLASYEMPQPIQGEAFQEMMSRYLREMQKPEALLLARTLFFSLIGWHLIEAALVHLVGTTPGKAIFGMRVKTLAGERLPLLTSLGRSFYVYVLGVGFYQYPFILIGMAFSLIRLTRTGQCLWDQHLKAKVEQPPLGAVRIVLAVCAFFALLLLQSVKFE